MGMSKSQEAVHTASDGRRDRRPSRPARRHPAAIPAAAADLRRQSAARLGVRHPASLADGAGGAGLHFRSDRAGGIRSAQILDFVSRHGVASRNTADAFIKEMLKYGYARSAAGRRGQAHAAARADRGQPRRAPWLDRHPSCDARPARPRPAAGDVPRHARRARPPLQPGSPTGCFPRASVREPERTFSLFTWLQQWRPGHGLADRRYRGGRPRRRARSDRPSCRSPPWPNG